MPRSVKVRGSAISGIKSGSQPEHGVGLVVAHKRGKRETPPSLVHCM